MAVGHSRVPCLLIFPARIETSGMQKHLASIPTSDGLKCYSDHTNKNQISQLNYKRTNIRDSIINNIVTWLRCAKSRSSATLLEAFNFNNGFNLSSALQAPMTCISSACSHCKTLSSRSFLWSNKSPSPWSTRMSVNRSVKLISLRSLETLPDPAVEVPPAFKIDDESSKSLPFDCSTRSSLNSCFLELAICQIFQN